MLRLLLRSRSAVPHATAAACSSPHAGVGRQSNRTARAGFLHLMTTFLIIYRSEWIVGPEAGRGGALIRAGCRGTWSSVDATVQQQQQQQQQQQAAAAVCTSGWVNPEFRGLSMILAGDSCFTKSKKSYYAVRACLTRQPTPRRGIHLP